MPILNLMPILTPLLIISTDSVSHRRSSLLISLATGVEAITTRGDPPLASTVPDAEVQLFIHVTNELYVHIYAPS